MSSKEIKIKIYDSSGNLIGFCYQKNGDMVLETLSGKTYIVGKDMTLKEVAKILLRDKKETEGKPIIL